MLGGTKLLCLSSLKFHCKCSQPLNLNILQYFKSKRQMITKNVILFFFWEEKVRVGDVTPTLLERIWAWRDTLKTKSRSKIRSHTHSLQFTSWFTSYSNRERKRGCHHTNKIMICGKDKKVRYLERIDNMTTLNMHNPTFKRNMISIL